MANRTSRSGRWWKLIGLAGVAGVAASGIVVARGERKRQAYPPDEIRDRLQARVTESRSAGPGRAPGADSPAERNGTSHRA